MFDKFSLLLLSLIVLVNCSNSISMIPKDKPLLGINITIDPGHGDTKAYDDFRIGPTGEREEWINLRVAKILAKNLSRAGANVLLTRTKDRDLSLGGRAVLAKRHRTDLLVSIHHNRSGSDPEMDLPIVYFYGPASMNPASVDFAKVLISGMRDKMTFEQAQAGVVYSDHLIYSSGTSILRNTIDQMPGVIGEGGFFTNTAGESRLKTRSYNKLEAEVYFQAILSYFDKGLPSARPLTPDTLSFLDLTKELQFQLDDGFGSVAFDEKSFQILQDGDTITSSWNSKTGILSAQPVASNEDKVAFRVFGRNSWGNALHPRPFSFTTQQGDKWRSCETWQSAFDKAEQMLTLLLSADSSSIHKEIEVISDAVQLYRLSLDIQIVHPKARMAEERILNLLEMKEVLLGEDLSVEIEEQRQRLINYYPE